MKKKVSEIVRHHLEDVVDLASTAVFLLLLAPDDDKEIDFDELHKINPEIKAWLKINNTEIDYPVVQTSDNTKYLTRNYRGDFATAGASLLIIVTMVLKTTFRLFMVTVWMGKLMFGGIAMFEQKDYFDSHEKGILYTEDATYDLEIMNFAVIDVNRTTIYNHDSNINGKNDLIINEIHNYSRQSRYVEVGRRTKLSFSLPAIRIRSTIATSSSQR